jgi:putative endonuclease
MMNYNKLTGNLGEDIAVDFLIKNDFKIVERNWKHRHWELDIIATKNNCLHFVEVKTRTGAKFGNPEESVNETKMNALKKAAEEYLLQHNEWTNIQFDVVSIFLQGKNINEILIIEDVFF